MTRRRWPSTATAACSSSNYAATSRSRRHRSHSPDRPHLDARGSRSRRHLRTSLRLRRSAGLPALRPAVRREHDPDDGDQRRRIWKYTDTDGDGIADKKELFTTGFGRAGNMESQQASLFWGMDNWLYSTMNAFRLRWTPHGLLKEPTGPNGAQWGVTQDDDGKVWFQSGASGLPGLLPVPGALREFRTARPVRTRARGRLGRTNPASVTSRPACPAPGCPMGR